jgi:hypothetical protein
MSEEREKKTQEFLFEKNLPSLARRISKLKGDD